MAKHYTSILLAIFCCLVGSPGILAGNRAWESTISNAGTNGTTSSPDHQLQKRWYLMEEDRAHMLWPDAHIKVCFELTQHQHKGQMKSTEEIVRGYMEEAIRLWHMAGLEENGNKFKIDFQDSSSEFCGDTAKRQEFLLVRYAGEGSNDMATTLGKRKEGLSSETFFRQGSKMVISDALVVGMGVVVSNVAHEIGHAWGLHHEHQDPKWWGKTWGGSVDDDKAFLGANWHCDQLADYDDAVTRVRNSHLPELRKNQIIQQMCLSRREAVNVGFTGAINWLPIEGGKSNANRKSPDWGSIMTYPSNCGGVVTGGNRATVILKNDGSAIKPIAKPNKHDVLALYALYGWRPTNPRVVFFQTMSELKQRFSEIFNKSNDVPCNGSNNSRRII
ncbi:hypothetical protein FQN57_002859 [Myotisia sp. PD_48]|nr:hypothetical protein FQN57_002859 [Myotisia sp. PD_48]